MPRLDRPVPQRKRSTSALDDTPLPEGPARSSSDLHERRRQPRCTTVPILHLCAPRGKGNDAGPNGNGADAPHDRPDPTWRPTASPCTRRPHSDGKQPRNWRVRSHHDGSQRPTAIFCSHNQDSSRANIYVTCSTASPYDWRPCSHRGINWSTAR